MYAFGYTTDYSTPIYSQFGSYLRLLRQVRFPAVPSDDKYRFGFG